VGIIFFVWGLVGMKNPPYLSSMKNETPLTEQEYQLVEFLWGNFYRGMTQELPMDEFTKEEVKQMKKILKKLKP
jgi:hypothetical protein